MSSLSGSPIGHSTLAGHPAQATLAKGQAAHLQAVPDTCLDSVERSHNRCWEALQKMDGRLDQLLGGRADGSTDKVELPDGQAHRLVHGAHQLAVALETLASRLSSL